MNDMAWMRWVMQTARTWEDISGIIRTIGIEGVDDDHRLFTEHVLRLNELIDSFNSKSIGMDTISGQKELFRTLTTYATDHFRREESIMELTGNPHLETHHRTHEAFMELLASHALGLEEGRVNISVALKMNILDWWIGHINGVDAASFTEEENRKYVVALHNGNLEPF